MGDLAARTGVTPRALRYYEEMSLLVPQRSPSGQRVYDEPAVERVQLIRQLYAAGMTSRSILELVPSLNSGTAAPGALELLMTERQRIARAITAMQGAAAALDRIISRTRGA